MLAFGLRNAPAVFQQSLNSVYADELGRFVVVCLDDILVYSKSEAEHVQHLRTVLQRLREHRLFAKLSKCQSCRSGVEVLGRVMSADGIGMDSHKVQAVQDWPQLRTVKDIMQFVGLTNYLPKVRAILCGYHSAPVRAPEEGHTFCVGRAAAGLKR